MSAAAAGVTLTDDDLARLADVASRDAWAGDRSSFAAHTTARPPG